MCYHDKVLAKNAFWAVYLTSRVILFACRPLWAFLNDVRSLKPEYIRSADTPCKNVIEAIQSLWWLTTSQIQLTNDERFTVSRRVTERNGNQCDHSRSCLWWYWKRYSFRVTIERKYQHFQDNKNYYTFKGKNSGKAGITQVLFLGRAGRWNFQECLDMISIWSGYDMGAQE